MLIINKNKLQEIENHLSSGLICILIIRLLNIHLKCDWNVLGALHIPSKVVLYWVSFKKLILFEICMDKVRIFTCKSCNLWNHFPVALSVFYLLWFLNFVVYLFLSNNSLFSQIFMFWVEIVYSCFKLIVNILFEIMSIRTNVFFSLWISGDCSTELTKFIQLI